MASFGEELKRERELRDISLKEISEATKISIRFLEALEQNNFDILPGGIFNRGFIRAYARFIGIDGEEMVNAYLHEVALKEARQSQRTSSGGGARPSPPRAPATPESRLEAKPERRSAPRSAPPSPLAGFEGRTSLVLWVMAAIAFIIGAVVVVMSLMGGGRVSAGAGQPPSTPSDLPSTAAAPTPPPEPLVAGLGEEQEPEPFAATGARPATTADDANGQAEPDAATQAPPAPPRDEPASKPADATGGEVDATAETRGEETPPEEPPVPRHRVRVLATETTVVTIRCADQLVLDQELWPGQTRTFTCEEPVLLGADNGGAVQYSIDGGPSALLGGLGERIEGLVVAPRPEPPSTTGPGGPRAGN